MGLRHRIANRLLKHAVRSGRDVPVDSLDRPAVVFAPHPDDDVLACGGTILRKTRLGAPVHVVYLTDGARSHDGLAAREKMASLRAREARAAAAVLGVADDDVTFLRFPDTALSRHASDATARVEAVLARHPDADLFVPSAQDLHPDHAATSHIVDAAVQASGRPRIRYEYELYLWVRWPWCAASTPLQVPGARARAILGAGRGTRLARLYPHVVPVESVLERKRAALDRHRSQMRPRRTDASWWTLPGMARGEFLPWFFSGYEFFRVSSGPRGRSGRARQLAAPLELTRPVAPPPPPPPSPPAPG